MTVHAACPCDKLSQMALQPGQPGLCQVAYDKSIRMVVFSVKLVEERANLGGADCVENPKGSRLWILARVLAFFGSTKELKPGRYFG